LHVLLFILYFIDYAQHFSATFLRVKRGLYKWGKINKYN